MAFFHKCNIPLASHRDFKRDPASAKSLAVLYRIVAASGSLPQQNFDFGRRSDTPPCAQDDIQRFCFATRVRKNGRTQFAPTGKFKIYCRGRHPWRPAKTKAYRKTTNQPVILSEVEVSPSEERGETKAPKRRRDLVTSFGGFLSQM